ncbi:galactose-specific lectin nattectin-like [Plectropomus leopardus]|uniref:galactose-specific lectin nattectin-like n=1 Tax=Plectropomus leopardus TaxID=160734 RepID=UPI001C4D7B66|nr:galactose-specific lectin nattectin-like [Plectropomus leopardus]
MEDVCERFPKRHCIRGWERLDEDRCMRIFWAKRDFDGAKEYCRRFGGTLLSLHNSVQMQRVSCLVWRRKFSDSKIWIGTRQNYRGGRFHNVDGTPMDYANWYPEQRSSRSRHCVESNYKVWGAWRNTDCDKEKHFVCTRML